MLSYKKWKQLNESLGGTFTLGLGKPQTLGTLGSRWDEGSKKMMGAGGPDMGGDMGGDEGPGGPPMMLGKKKKKPMPPPMDHEDGDEDDLGHGGPDMGGDEDMGDEGPDMGDHDDEEGGDEGPMGDHGDEEGDEAPDMGDHDDEDMGGEEDLGGGDVADDVPPSMPKKKGLMDRTKDVADGAKMMHKGAKKMIKGMKESTHTCGCEKCKKCSKKMTKEDAEFFQSLQSQMGGTFFKADQESSTGWTAVTEDALIPPTDPNVGLADEGQPAPGDVGYAPQGRIGAIGSFAEWSKKYVNKKKINESRK